MLIIHNLNQSIPPYTLNRIEEGICPASCVQTAVAANNFPHTSFNFEIDICQVSGYRQGHPQLEFCLTLSKYKLPMASLTKFTAPREKLLNYTCPVKYGSYQCILVFQVARFGESHSPVIQRPP